MAFKYIEFGEKVSTNPVEAHGVLAGHFWDFQGNTTKVAKYMGVNKGTVSRWCTKLAKQGYGDPRAGKKLNCPQPKAKIPLESFI